MVAQKSISKSMNAKILGSGKQTIVLAHGYGGDNSVWDNVINPLSELYQVLVFDWSFSGVVKDLDLFDAVKYSSYDAFADDLIDLLEEMNLKSSVFVGHSMSGMIGCIASVKRPDLFTRLVLVASSPRFINTDEYEGGFEIPQVEQLFASIESNYDQWAPSFASIVVDKNDPLSVEKFAGSLTRMGVKTALPLAKSVFLSDHRDVLEQVTTPCTIIQSVNDVVVPNSVPLFMQKKIKGKCNVEVIDIEGHFPQLTAPKQFLEVIDKAMIDSL
ncbi:OLC1v1037253C1 [Oldenlandia corymbosa var. corymbosa]|uniref:OLC1v1037253C1 n=1 Tax=Oldenlandia corymbosa var. corymbosa TaxID=529605 RepID=A0AAV1D0D9_OLDCO|nr:OLC1v1037253C1 [Oldenlandia corymbosa var. corymbosa]